LRDLATRCLNFTLKLLEADQNDDAKRLHRNEVHLMYLLYADYLAEMTGNRAEAAVLWVKGFNLTMPIPARSGTMSSTYPPGGPRERGSPNLEIRVTAALLPGVRAGRRTGCLACLLLQGQARRPVLRCGGLTSIERSTSFAERFEPLEG